MHLKASDEWERLVESLLQIDGGGREGRSKANCAQRYLSDLILIRESELNIAKWRYTVGTKGVI